MNRTSIAITTHNRRKDLEITLAELFAIVPVDMEVWLCVDGCTDGTEGFVRDDYPTINVLVNNRQRGLIYSRNRLMAHIKTPFALFLDDDASLLTENFFDVIEGYFDRHPECAVMAARIFWGNERPGDFRSDEIAERVRGFVGCGHVWRLAAWNDIRPYPDWFVFYGEENFAAFELFLKNWQVHYNPDLFVHHRVVVSERRKQSDYTLRTRRAIRSGWYLYLIFYPWKQIPKKIGYTLNVQLRKKVFKGDLSALVGIGLACLDVLINSVRIKRWRTPLSRSQMSTFMALAPTRIYWYPKGGTSNT